MKMFGLFGGKKKSSTHQMSADTKKKIQQGKFLLTHIRN